MANTEAIILVALLTGFGIPFSIWIATTLVKILRAVDGTEYLLAAHTIMMADHEARLRELEGFHHP